MRSKGSITFVVIAEKFTTFVSSLANVTKSQAFRLEQHLVQLLTRRRKCWLVWPSRNEFYLDPNSALM